MRILALSPHTDDVELGAGGTLTKLIQQGAIAHVVAFSTGYAAEDEFWASMHTLGVSEATVWNFENKKYYLSRQVILDMLIKLGSAFCPDTILVPSTNDIHQDHQVATIEAQRAFRHCTILGYELPRNTVAAPFRSLCFSGLSEQHIDLKIEALALYESQSGHKYMQGEIIRSLARVRGLQIGVKYAEAFEVLKWVL